MAMVKHHGPDEAAIEWLIRQRDPAFRDWSEFTDWLDQDPEHAQAYDRIAAVESGVADGLSHISSLGQSRSAAVATRRDGRRTWISRRGFAAGAAAIAAAIAVVIVPSQLVPTQALYSVSTPAGTHRTVVLEPGTSVTLNGSTVVVLDRKNPRFASLQQGEAMFNVVHDSSRPFRVRIGESQVTDVGTIFNILRDGETTEVAVAEGAVEYDSGGEVVTLDAGEQLRDSPDRLELSKVDEDEVSSWREGRLVYRGTPLAIVAKDLSRNVGKRVVADPRVAARPVTAVLQLPEDREQLPLRLEQLLDVEVEQSQSQWVLKPRD